MKRFFLRTKSTSVCLTLTFAILLVLTLLIVAALPPATSATQGTAGSDASHKPARQEFVPGEALVRYRSERIAKRLAYQTLISSDGRPLSIQLERFEGADIVPGLRLAHVAAEDTMAMIEALKKQPDVLYAEPNYLMHLDVTPNDPRFTSGELYGLTKIGAPTAWNTTTGSSSVVVGIIDEGIDKLHPDLGTNIWTNPGETPGNGIDDDGNGFIDDINGYNFANDTGTIPGENHATHVAGTIGGVGNNGVGVVGVNWQVGLMSLKFIGGSSGSTSNAIRACNYTKQMRDLWVSSGGTKGANVRVLNNSYGGGSFSQAFLDAINVLNGAGILFVAAAGNAPDSPEPNNDLVPHYPGSYDAPNIITVASTDSGDGLSSFSHYGLLSVQMGAPGTGILSTTAGNTYSFFNGTSMATPHVAGAAALLLAANPNLTVQQLRGLLIFNGDPLASLAGKTVTGRRLNVATSLQTLAANDTTPPGTPTNFHLNSQTGRALNLGWTASGDDGAVGQGTLYQISFTDATTGVVIKLKNAIPLASGGVQSLAVSLPYRHTNGTLLLREFDDVGNEGAPAALNVSVSLAEGDPYTTSVGAGTLSTGGTALNLIGDDKLKLNQALPFSFPFFGQNFSSVNVSTNGNLFFSAPPTRSNGDADDVPSSVIGLAKYKMVSGLWDDLRTDRGVGQDVYLTSDASHVVFRWQGVTFGDGTPATEFPVNFEVELRADGTILTRYGSGNTNIFPVVGIGGGEPEAYSIPSHTSEQLPINLTNAAQVTFTPRASGPTPTPSPSVQFALPQYDVFESGKSATVTVIRSGDTSGAASVDFGTTDGTAAQKGDYEQVAGRLNFAAGEASRSFAVLIVDDIFREPTETVNLTLSNPIGMTLGGRTTATVAIFDNDFVPPSLNPLDNPDAIFFVRQHYLDFLNREPDSSGLAFWANQITSCGSDTACIKLRRINASAAFFLSIEFQETGYLAERLYKSAYGDATGTSTFNGTHQLPVPIVRYQEFLPDTQQLGEGVVIGQPGADQKLEANKQSFIASFVQRSRFLADYPTSMTPTAFVDQMFARAGVTPSAADRTAAINEFGGAPNTADTAARARALRKVAENSLLNNAEKSKAFVLMQYFGYLRRDPNVGTGPNPDTDYTGYDFWLTKLNQFNGNFVSAQMVEAFIVSGEYKGRFGP